MAYYKELRDSFHTWYHQSPGVRNLRKLVSENDYRDTTHEPRTKYQIDRYECWRITTYMLCLPVGAMAAYNGYRLANEQFAKVNELTIYQNRVSMWRVRSNFRWLGAMGYSVPVMIRTYTFVAFLLGVPALAGVYRDDTDHVSHYAVSSCVGALLVSLMTTSNHYRGVRQKIVAAGLGMLPGVFAGIFLSQAQKQDIYPFYEMYKERWRKIDPLWAEFTEKQEDSLVLAGSSDHMTSTDSCVLPGSYDHMTSTEQITADQLESCPPSVSSDVVSSSSSQSFSEKLIKSASDGEKL